MEDREEIRIITLSHRIDIHNVFEVEEELVNLIQPKNLKVIIDFKKVEYFGSNGIRILMLAKRKLENFGGELILVNITGFVHKILSAVDLLEIFKISPDIDSAIKQFS